MNFTLKLSLEHIALVRIAASFWGQANIRALIAKSGISSDPYQKSEKWQNIEDRVIENIQQLPQPELLKQKILGFIKPIGLEILKWIKYHSKHYYNIDLPCEFHWTPWGTIDKQKTAEALIRDEKLDIKIRYNLACIYCLEDYILELFYKLPEDLRNVIFTIEGSVTVIQHDLVNVWTSDLYQRALVTEKLNNYSSLHNKLNVCRSIPSIHTFQVAVAYGNKTAMEYFLPKLALEQRQEAFVLWAAKIGSQCCNYNVKNTDPYEEYNTEVLCFLLSHMNKERQTEIFKRYAYGVLKCFLDWPLQNLFIENAVFLSEFISKQSYISLLELIIDKVVCGYKDYDYLNLFSEFWSHIPETHKRSVLQYGGDSLLEKLFHIKNLPHIKLIFQDTLGFAKELFIFSAKGRDICKYLIYGDEWDLLKFFITECISSKHDMQKLIETLEEHITKDEFRKMKDKWNKFFHLSDDLFCKFDKHVPESETGKV